MSDSGEGQPVRPLRVGILGAGERGTALAHVAAQFPGVSIVAVGDDSYVKASALAEQWNAIAYTFWQIMLSFEHLDAVFIATPSRAHPEQVLSALDQGTHVYVEKPPALDMEMAQRIGEAAQRQDKIVHVGLQHRYSELIVPWYQALEGKAISVVHAHLYRGLPTTKEGRDPTITGGQIVDEGLHLIDLCRYLIDEVTCVAGFAGRALWREGYNWSGTDSAAIALQFASGAVGTLTTTYAMPLAIPGHIALDVVAEGPLLVRYTGVELQIVTEAGVETWTLEEPPDLAAVRAFLEAVSTGDRTPLRVPYDDALQSLHLALACQEAATNGKVIRL